MSKIPRTISNAWLAISILTVSAVLIVGICVVSDSLANYAQLNRDAYLAEQASLLIVRYIDAHDNRLPRDWDELETAFPGSTAEAEGFTLTEIRTRIEIRFDVLASDQPGQRIFIFSDGTLSAPDPNDRVRSHIGRVHRPKTANTDKAQDTAAVSKIIGNWSLERLDIASERGVVQVADTGSVKITETVLEVSCLWGERERHCPFEYAWDERTRTIELTAGEWDGGVPGAGPNRYTGLYELEGEVLRLSFGRFHRPDSFTPKPLKPAVDAIFATPGSDTAWFLRLRRSR